jgi:hypothetical protein
MIPFCITLLLMMKHRSTIVSYREQRLESRLETPDVPCQEDTFQPKEGKRSSHFPVILKAQSLSFARNGVWWYTMHVSMRCCITSWSWQFKVNNRGWLSEGSVSFHDDALSHTAAHNVQKLQEWCFEVLEHHLWTTQKAPRSPHVANDHALKETTCGMLCFQKYFI